VPLPETRGAAAPERGSTFQQAHVGARRLQGVRATDSRHAAPNNGDRSRLFHSVNLGHVLK